MVILDRVRKHGKWVKNSVAVGFVMSVTVQLFAFLVLFNRMSVG